MIPKALESIGGNKDKKSLRQQRTKGLGKAQMFGEEQATQCFRLWSIKLEDYDARVVGEKFREAM